jgi:tetratricopeptide (TPR) repeat protein
LLVLNCVVPAQELTADEHHSRAVTIVDDPGLGRLDSEAFEKAKAAAIAHSTRAVELDPKNWKRYYHRSAVFTVFLMTDEVIKDLSTAIRLEPKLSDAFYARALTYVDEGECEKAVSDFSAVVALKYVNYDNERVTPENVLFERGKCYVSLAEYDLGIVDLRAVSLINPEHEKARFGLGMLYSTRKLYAEAIKEYSAVIELDPEHPRYYFNRAVAYLVMKKPALALQDFNKAIELEEDQAEFYEGRARAYRQLGKKALQLKDDQTAKKIRLRS